MARTVGVRFRQAGKIFYYDAGDYELDVGTYVVVETSHGVAVGRVVIAPDQVIANESTPGEELKPLLRLATQEDVDRMEAAREKAHEAVRVAKRKASELGLDMSIATGEFDLDESQFTAYFTANERVDFRGLVRELSRELNVRVQLLQVGDRDRAKLVDGFDICGERLCCASWMTNFPSVSIRMAKEQDLPLNPQKISGVCGRLYCCLTFEYEDYKALRGTLPKVGAVLSTPAGEAKVTGIDFNREVVKLVLTQDRTPVEINAIDFRMQNGLTVRPIELVRSIEGPLRPLFEDSEANGTSTTSEGQRGQQQRSSRERRGGPARDGQPSAGAEPGAPQAGRRRGRAQQPEAQHPAQQAPQEQTEEGARKRRRRRRRGRGGGGGTAPEGGSD